MLSSFIQTIMLKIRLPRWLPVKESVSLEGNMICCLRYLKLAKCQIVQETIIYNCHKMLS